MIHKINRVITQTTDKTNKQLNYKNRSIELMNCCIDDINLFIALVSVELAILSIEIILICVPVTRQLISGNDDEQNRQRVPNVELENFE